MLESYKSDLEWLSATVKKYGFIICIFIGIYWLIKRVWFWVVLPILLCGILTIIGTNVISLSYLILPVYSVISIWVFIFSFGSCLFKKKKNE